MLHLAGLFTHLFDPVAWSDDKNARGSGDETVDLSDFERLAIGEPLFSRDAERASDREEPRFASMVMPPYS